MEKQPLVNTAKLEHLLQTHWTEFIDIAQIRRLVEQHVSNTEFKKLKQQQFLHKHTKITITSFHWSEHGFEICLEYTAPKGDGIVIGTNVYNLYCTNSTIAFDLRESYGTHFEP